ncbi:DALR anticodon-binding domain-containing protein [Labrys sedimenti]|uniref:DALR anticodon-binding domain-containing protein n=1 Tax=Labrys sedimenti TaxID=3106036 RepID=UPI002ACA67E5|nr:DALR anticodon-binding domain-containing protein [Labrys sp. ZIDIC5]MDZ5448791.1 DALR anticodon-binding domain-containing protein [Labrys sp. ZIDIC5]
MDPIEWLRGGVQEAIASLQAAGRLPGGLDAASIGVEVADQIGRGDFTSNAALVLSRPAGMPSWILAGLLAETLESIDGIAGVEIAGPGFLNLTLAPAIWARMLAGVLRAGSRYGARTREGAGYSTIDFGATDPQSSRPLSPARCEAVGTALANMLDHLGSRADRHFRTGAVQADVIVRLGPLLGLKGRNSPPIAGHRADELDLSMVAGIIGDDAACLGMLMQPADAPLTLDLDLLLDQSHANPVFELHYAHARCCALRQQGEIRGHGDCDENHWDVGAFEDEGAQLILRLLALYPSQIDLAVRQREPCRLLHYLCSLAGGLHQQYYRSLGAPHLRFIRDDDRLLTGARLALVRGVETVLKSGLGLLGSSAPDEMR